MIVEPFQHRHAGHCETGVTSSLLRHAGFELSEPMALGLSSSLTFFHFPFVKVGGFPITAYRMPPGSVRSGLRKVLRLSMRKRRFGNADAAMAALDAELAAGRPVGLQTSVYWLPYFPAQMRFHFNAHNLIVYGKDGDDYLISDPVFDQPQRCPSADLRKARFARGTFAPKGLMYQPQDLPRHFEPRAAVKAAITRTWKMMLHTPLPYVGVRAIERLAREFETLDRRRPDVRWQRLYAGNIVRMQEEIGTGGGGFRFMYAAFLQEAADRLNDETLREISQRMTACGDAWRQFALQGALFARRKPDITPASLAAGLRECATQERAIYEALKRWTKAG
ncbi:MAG: BtrH N-terminal domain-containing protein [Solimonas sp.]